MGQVWCLQAGVCDLTTFAQLRCKNVAENEKYPPQGGAIFVLSTAKQTHRWPFPINYTHALQTVTEHLRLLTRPLHLQHKDLESRRSEPKITEKSKASGWFFCEETCGWANTKPLQCLSENKPIKAGSKSVRALVCVRGGWSSVLTLHALATRW